jgi:hypothetical protein
MIINEKKELYKQLARIGLFLWLYPIQKYSPDALFTHSVPRFRRLSSKSKKCRK